MKQPSTARTFCILVPLLWLAACATHPAPGISGHWKAVNHYAMAPEEIPLYQAYVFYGSPMDRTLKTMLTRWAQDSKMTLAYQHPSDFSLYEPVSRIHTGNVQEAVAMLTAFYAAQHVLVTVSSNAIVVRQTDIPPTGPAASGVSAPASGKPG